MTIRLRFWLAVLDIAHALRLSLAICLWIVGKVSDATDWGEVAECGDGDPF